MNALKEQRERAMLSQDELSARSGVAKTQIIKIEKDKARPWPRTVRKLAEALSCPVSDLASLRIERGEPDGKQE